MHFKRRITTLLRYIELGFRLLQMFLVIMISIGMASLVFGSMMWFKGKAYGFLAGWSFLELWGMAAIGTISAVVLIGFFIFVFSRIPLSWRARAHKSIVFFAGTVGRWFGIIEKWVAATTPVLIRIDVFFERFFLRVIFCVMGITFVAFGIMLLWDGLWTIAIWLLVVGFFMLFVFLKWKSFASWGSMACACKIVLRNIRKK